MKTDTRTLRVMINFGLDAKSQQETFRAILDYARTHGVWQCLTAEDRGVSMGAEPWDGGVTGIIATGGWTAQRGLQYARCGIPVVLLDPSPEISCGGHPLADFPRVMRDSRAIGEKAAEYYLKRGYRNFAWVGEPGGWYWGAERRAGYEEALAASGFHCAAFEPAGKAGGAAAVRRGARRLVRFLRSLPTPAAVFAANDSQGRLVLNACSGDGLRVPEDIAVLGVDDDWLRCESTVPTLSSIRKGDYRCGWIAAAMLDDLMHGRSIANPHVTVAPQGVVTRGSTGYEAMSDPTVALAVKFIRAHAAAGAVGVETVARAAGCSRRYLERAFRGRLGRSVHGEIARERIENVKRLLETGTMPIGEIIATAGFSGEKHLSTLFKRLTGTTMRDWRSATRARD